MPNEVVNTAHAFTVRELTGQRRSVRMVARALPYRPFTLKRAQRVETTWNPGSPEGTLTMLGASRQPTSVRGMWKTKYLGEQVTVNSLIGGAGLSAPLVVDGEQITTALDATKLFGSICDEGQLLEVQWGEIVRQGVLKEFEESWTTAHDVEWSMEFEWQGDGEAAGDAVFTNETSLSDAAGVMRRQLTNVRGLAEAPFPASAAFNTAVTDAVAALTRAVAQVEGATENLQLGAMAPADAARRTVAVTNGMLAQTQTLLDVLTAQPPRALNIGAPIAALTLGQVVQAAAYTTELRRAVQALRRTAIARNQALAQGLQADLLATHVARAGDDLRDVARRYYGTPFQWRALLAFNGLTSAELAAGQLVLVPRDPAGGSA